MAKNILTGASIFESFQKLRKDSNIPENNFDWFRKTINGNIRSSDMEQVRDQIISDPSRQRQRMFDGMLYFFFYNEPEYMTTLPFYDTFPLVLILSRHRDTFFGVNFHFYEKHLYFLFVSTLQT